MGCAVVRKKPKPETLHQLSAIVSKNKYPVLRLSEQKFNSGSNHRRLITILEAKSYLEFSTGEL